MYFFIYFCCVSPQIVALTWDVGFNKMLSKHFGKWFSHPAGGGERKGGTKCFKEGESPGLDLIVWYALG